jgi:hypothetical protein
MRLLRLLALPAIALLAGCTDTDYGFTLRLTGVHVGSIREPSAMLDAGSVAATIPADDVGLLQVSASVQPNANANIDAQTCVDIVSAVGELTCPGTACTMLFDGQDGSVTNLEHGSHHIIMNVPVGNGAHEIFPIYRAPESPTDDEITGTLYMSACANATDPSTRLSGSSRLDVIVMPPLDMAAPPPMDML